LYKNCTSGVNNLLWIAKTQGDPKRSQIIFFSNFSY